ncbi:MAG: SspB family protein [Alphaproteobacteria bacterium]
MADDLIRYDVLAQDALRGVLRKVLSEVAKTGLPGEHHFFITFATKAPGVRISTRLIEQYPEDMTIVIQHQYWDLTVTEHAVEIGLSFNGIPERLLVPFSAIKAFVDPSVQFALQFEPATANDETAAGDPKDTADTGGEVVAGPAPAEESPAADAPASEDGEADDTNEKVSTEAQVVSLDAFRKKS